MQVHNLITTASFMHQFLSSSFCLCFFFQKSSDLLFMNLCNKGKRPVLEAITHRPKTSLIYTVYKANLISHFVLSLECKSSWEPMIIVHNFTPYQPTKNIYNTFLCFCHYNSIYDDIVHICYSKDQMLIKFIIFMVIV